LHEEVSMGRSEGQPSRYPKEFRERAVRMVYEAYEAGGSTYAVIPPIAEKLGVSRRTLYYWVRRAEIDDGKRPGVSSAERARLAELERENRELRRANEILKAASAFFAAELDRRSPR
jgi:transposase